MKNYRPASFNLLNPSLTPSDPNVWNLAGDYSSTPVDLFIQPPSDSILFMHEVKMALTTQSTLNDEGDFGQINGGLVNGIRIYVERRDLEGAFQEIGELTAGRPIKTNWDFVFYGSREDTLDLGQGNKTLKTVISGLDFGVDDTSRLRVNLADDLSSLTSLSMRVTGEFWIKDNVTLNNRQTKAIV